MKDLRIMPVESGGTNIRRDIIFVDHISILGDGFNKASKSVDKISQMMRGFRTRYPRMAKIKNIYGL